MASDIRISELNEINVNRDINEFIINSRETSNDTGISKKIQMANLLTDNIVKTNNITNCAVTNTKLAGQAVTPDKIADKTITNAQIKARTIGNDLLNDNAVDNRVLTNDCDYTVRGITATSSVASPAVQVSNRLTVPTGQVTLNSIAYTFPANESPRNFLRTDGAGNLTWAEAVPGDGTALVFSDVSPVGTILPYAGVSQSSVPDNKWINLFGTRRFLGSDYPELRDLLGTTWGPRQNSDGTSNPSGAYYALPDIRGRAVLGAGQGNDGTDSCTTAFATYGGAYKHTLTVGEMPVHRHGFTGANGNANDQSPSPFELVKDDVEQTHNPGSSYNTGSTGILDSGGDLPHNNTQPYVAMSYIIKAKPDDIQQYDVSVGPGLSALDEQGLQTSKVNLSSSEIGLKVSDDFTFDGSSRLQLKPSVTAPRVPSYVKLTGASTGPPPLGSALPLSYNYNGTFTWPKAFLEGTGIDPDLISGIWVECEGATRFNGQYVQVNYTYPDGTNERLFRVDVPGTPEDHVNRLFQTVFVPVGADQTDIVFQLTSSTNYGKSIRLVGVQQVASIA